MMMMMMMMVIIKVIFHLRYVFFVVEIKLLQKIYE